MRTKALICLVMTLGGAGPLYAQEWGQEADAG